MPFLNIQLQKTLLEFDKLKFLRSECSFSCDVFAGITVNSIVLNMRGTQTAPQMFKPQAKGWFLEWYAYFISCTFYTAPTSCVTWPIGQSWQTGLCKLKNHLTIRSYRVFHHWSIGLLLSWTRLSDYKHDPYWHSLAYTRKSSRTHGKINYDQALKFLYVHKLLRKWASKLFHFKII